MTDLAVISELVSDGTVAKDAIEQYLHILYCYKVAKPDGWYKFTEVSPGKYITRSGKLKDWFDLQVGNIRHDLSTFGSTKESGIMSDYYQAMAAQKVSNVWLKSHAFVNVYTSNSVAAILLNSRGEYGQRFRKQFFAPNSIEIFQGFSIPKLKELICTKTLT